MREPSYQLYISSPSSTLPSMENVFRDSYIALLLQNMKTRTTNIPYTFPVKNPPVIAPLK